MHKTEEIMVRSTNQNTLLQLPIGAPLHDLGTQIRIGEA